jgi:hypothetical protein
MLQTILAGLIFLLAITLPIYLLRRFHPLAWPLHVLAVVVALAIGFLPGTAFLNTLPGTFAYGFAIGFLFIWGLGGLVGFRHKSASSARAS